MYECCLGSSIMNFEWKSLNRQNNYHKKNPKNENNLSNQY